MDFSSQECFSSGIQRCCISEVTHTDRIKENEYLKKKMADSTFFTQQ